MFVKCQSSFCEYMIQMYKKNKKNGKFYGCEKLYFTELLYQRKRKARDRKENFTIAPPRSCFVTVSVFVGISVDVPFVEGSRTGSENVQCPFDNPHPTPRHSTDHSPDSSVSVQDAGADENSEELVPELLLTAAGLRHVCFCVDRKDMELGTSRLRLRFCLASLPRGLFFPPFNSQTSNRPHHWFYWTASPGMHYWLVNEDYE